MERFNVQEIIEQAVQTERLGHDFYSSMSARFDKDGKLKDLFDLLAVKEQAHEKIFLGLKDKAGDAQIENPGEVSQYLRAIVESEFFLGKNKALPSFEFIHSVEDAVLYARGFEIETLLYYYALRDVVKEKDIVDQIINEEKTHIVWLSEYLKKG